MSLPSVFVREDGEPYQFWMNPGKHKQEIQDLVNKGGGQMAAALVPGVITLVHPDDQASLRPAHSTYYSTHFIYDCLEQQQLLSLDGYRIELYPASSRKRSLSVRRAYTNQEDAIIIKFLEKIRKMRLRGYSTNGVKVWQELEQTGTIERSWQSMRERYRKIIQWYSDKQKNHLLQTVDCDSSRKQKLRVSKVGSERCDANEHDSETSSSNEDIPTVFDEQHAIKKCRRERQQRAASSSNHNCVAVHEMSNISSDTESDPLSRGHAFSEIDVRSHEIGNHESVTVASAIVEKLSTETNEPAEVILHALYVCSGNVAQARNYLHGHPSDSRPWDTFEDEVLTGIDQEAINELRQWRSAQEMEHRYDFLKAAHMIDT